MEASVSNTVKKPKKRKQLLGKLKIQSNRDSDVIKKTSRMKEPRNEKSGTQQLRSWKRINMEKKLLKREQRLKKQKEEADSKKALPPGRDCSVSIAIPGSILENAQTHILKTYLAGQIARAAIIFGVDEVIVFDDMGITRSKHTTETMAEEDRLNLSEQRMACSMMAHILQFLECPQYLRKSLFPIHMDLMNAGVLNPLESVHHLMESDCCDYREGVVLKKEVKQGAGSYANVGLKQDVLLDKAIKPGVRVTVHLLKSDTKKLKGTVVAPHIPRLEGGLYWGYTVRLAHSLGTVFTECPFQGGYDVTIGTSDRGMSVDEFSLPPFKHLLIVFGGLKGLEASLEADEKLRIDEPQSLFNHYLNTCPGQGSRTIRTEEAVLITLAALRPSIGRIKGGL